ncbi:MAG: hypothetical protein M5R38_07495 [Candidatus Methylomirabilis sp.]|nr:hypothetical protein [Candidatus Methylomirabilis sp.]
MTYKSNSPTTITCCSPTTADALSTPLLPGFSIPPIELFER